MAHAGNPTGLTQQPATSNSLWKPLLTAVVILAVGFALAMATSFVIGKPATKAIAVDRSYDQIETQRGAALSAVTGNTDAIEKAAAARGRAMSGVPAVTVDSDAVKNAAAARGRAMSRVPTDTSYNAVEKARGAAILSGTSVDHSLDQIEARRGVAPLSGPSVDRSMDDIEARRGAR